MNLRRTINRLGTASPWEIPGIVWNKFERSLGTAFVRSLTRPTFTLDRRPRFKKIPASSASLLHADVWTSDFSERFKSLFPKEFDQIIEQADLAKRFIFDLLGSGWVDLKEFSQRTDLKFVTGTGRQLDHGFVEGLIPWHFDIKKGIGWNPRTFYTDIVYGQIPGVDVKLPWELSRANHFLTLGQAYLLTRDETYAQAFVDQIQDWILQNPHPYGVNWACTMDVALRASNWIMALDMFRHSATVTEEVRRLVYGSLMQHGRHISSNLEWNAGFTSNHYLADLLGLFDVGRALGRDHWTDFAEQELKKEIFNQTYSDGFDYEASTAYHRLVLEIFFYFSLGLVRSQSKQPEGKIREDAFKERLYLMFESLSRISTGGGRMPLIGDNDSGRIHLLSAAGDADIRALLYSGVIFLNAMELAPEEAALPSDIIWLFGLEAASLLDSPIEEEKKSGPKPARYSSGLLVLRGPDDRLVFSAQPNGTNGLGNHTHNDKLSLTLDIKGDEFFVDPGSGLYTPDPALRNRLRSTSVHSTVIVDGCEQNEFPEGDLFSLKNQALVEVEEFGEEGFVRAVHSGYERLPDPVRHRRSIQRHATILIWEIHDEFEGRGLHRLCWNFTLGPRISAKLVDAHRAIVEGEKGGLEIIFPAPLTPLQIGDGIYSPSYGVTNPTKKIRCEIEATLPLKTRIELRWFNLHLGGKII